MSENTPVSPSEAKQKADKLKEIARDYDKQAWALLLVAPLAMLTYSMDKVGVIGFSSWWERATWSAWIVLVAGVAVGGWRMFVISATWHARSDSADAPSRTDLETKADNLEKKNKCLKQCQIWLICVGIVILFGAHVTRAALQYDRIEALEDAIKLDRLEKEAKERGLNVP